MQGQVPPRPVKLFNLHLVPLTKVRVQEPANPTNALLVLLDSTHEGLLTVICTALRLNSLMRLRSLRLKKWGTRGVLKRGVKINGHRATARKQDNFD